MSEPMYDDTELEKIAEFQNKDLIEKLWRYSLSLEEYVVRLRNRINSLTKRGEREPFPDPESDFSERFYDHPAYHLYAEILDSEECEDLIIE